MTVKVAPETALRRAKAKLRKATALFKKEVSDVAMLLEAGCEGWRSRGSDTWAYDPSVLTATELRFIETELGEILDAEEGMDRLNGALICRAIGELGASRMALLRFDIQFPEYLQTSATNAIAAQEMAIEVLYALAEVGVRARDIRYIGALQAA